MNPLMNERVRNVGTEDRYPLLEVNLTKFRHNLNLTVETCTEAGVSIAGVIKGFTALPELVKLFENSGCKQLASSRLEQLRDARELGITLPLMLIRIPMLREIPEVIELTDYSLNSEPVVIEALNEEAGRQGKRHRVVLMADLGDLREGFWDYDELVQTAVHIERDLPHLDLAGVGTNLGCYGSVVASPEKMNDLIAIAERIEAEIGRPLEIISGGGSTSYPLIPNGKMPARINHLRMGEQIELAYDAVEFDYFAKDQAEAFYQDVFVLKAEIIEVKNKPTHPVGALAVDCFGNVNEYVDRGIRRRALAGMGKADYAYIERIRPLAEGVEIIGASSDHTILDIQDNHDEIKVGDIMSFLLSYGQVVMVTSSRSILIRYVE